MITRITSASIVEAAGSPAKRIEEFIGKVNSGHANISIARMKSPEGWEEPGQRPEFTEYTVVLHGIVHVRTDDGAFDVSAGGAIEVPAGSWVQYSTPYPDGAEYISVCIPAFSIDTVHRDDA